MTKRNIILWTQSCLCLAVLIVTGLTLSSRLHAQDATPDLRVVKFHADWCAGCQIMEPWYQELKQTYADNPDVEFIVFDATDNAARDAAFDLSSEKNLDDIYVAYQKRTGLIILVDQNGEILQEISYKQGKDALINGVATAL